MPVRLVYWKLEIKRAYQRFPQMFAGATALLFLAGAVALLAGRALYGDAAAGRIAVGVVMPREDTLAKQMVSMVSSLDSVKSMCDLQYMEREEGIRGLKSGELSAVMEVPEGLIQGIMNGTNPSVRILMPKDAWLESRIFQELTRAGAEILAASQAGIYAGNEIYRSSGREGEILELERDLNQIFLSYSLPREDYFQHRQVSATGDVPVPVFYGISAYVLFLLLLAIPVSGYLLPIKPALRQKLTLAGIGSLTRVTGRVGGLASLLFSISLVMGLVLYGISGAEKGWNKGFSEGMAALFFLLLTCLAVSAFVVLVYQAAGTLLGGIMLLFLVVTAQHFLAGGFLPLVFLPSGMRGMASVMPSAVLMDGVKFLLAGEWSGFAAGKLVFLCFGGALGAAVLEEREGRKGL